VDESPYEAWFACVFELVAMSSAYTQCSHIVWFLLYTVINAKRKPHQFSSLL
jgi:hypothetical protein